MNIKEEKARLPLLEEGYVIKVSNEKLIINVIHLINSLISPTLFINLTRYYKELHTLHPYREARYAYPFPQYHLR